MENMDDLFVIIKQEPEIYTQEEIINQHGLSPMAFADLNKENE